jgi:uncharacterized membrane protein
MNENMRRALQQVMDETAELIALITTVSRPGENLTAGQAIHRYWENGDADSAAEIAVLCARADPDVQTEEALRAAAHRILDQSIA